MPASLLLLLVFSAASFLFFGYMCLRSPLMVLEFERYGLSQYRRLNGYLQLFGALSLLAGIWVLPFAMLGSLGLSLLMFLGLIVRIRIRDSLLKSLPALGYALLNLLIFLIILERYLD
jgi:hypothetical protein